MTNKLVCLFLISVFFLLLSSCSNNSVKEDKPSLNPSESDKKIELSAAENSKKNTFDYSMILGQSVGSITKESTKEQLLEIYGAENITFEERMFMDDLIHTSSLFKGTENAIEIYWTDETYSKVSFIELTGNKGKWETKEGIKLGSTLKELEIVNGKAFKIYGYYGAEGSGMNESWEGGSISSNVQINFGGGIPAESDMDKELMYENKISSDNEKLQAINPTVISIGFYF